MCSCPRTASPCPASFLPSFPFIAPARAYARRRRFVLPATTSIYRARRSTCSTAVVLVAKLPPPPPCFAPHCRRPSPPLRCITTRRTSSGRWRRGAAAMATRGACATKAPTQCLGWPPCSPPACGASVCLLWVVGRRVRLANALLPCAASCAGRSRARADTTTTTTTSGTAPSSPSSRAVRPRPLFIRLRHFCSVPGCVHSLVLTSSSW
jgi:hypothetical protein